MTHKVVDKSQRAQASLTEDQEFETQSIQMQSHTKLTLAATFPDARRYQDRARSG